MKFLLVLILLGLSACPTAQDESVISEKCLKTGAKCKLPGNALGVCIMAADGAFNCASQH